MRVSSKALQINSIADFDSYITNRTTTDAGIDPLSRSMACSEWKHSRQGMENLRYWITMQCLKAVYVESRECNIGTLSTTGVCGNVCEAHISSLKTLFNENQPYCNSDAESVRIRGASMTDRLDLCRQGLTFGDSCLHGIGEQEENLCGFRSAEAKSQFCSLETSKSDACCVSSNRSRDSAAAMASLSDQGRVYIIAACSVVAFLLALAGGIWYFQKRKRENARKIIAIGNINNNNGKGNGNDIGKRDGTRRGSSTLESEGVANKNIQYGSRQASASIGQFSNTSATTQLPPNVTPLSTPTFYKTVTDYMPHLSDEIDLRRKDIIQCKGKLNADWLWGKNLRTGLSGLFPMSNVKLTRFEPKEVKTTTAMIMETTSSGSILHKSSSTTSSSTSRSPTKTHVRKRSRNVLEDTSKRGSNIFEIYNVNLNSSNNSNSSKNSKDSVVSSNTQNSITIPSRSASTTNASLNDAKSVNGKGLVVIQRPPSLTHSEASSFNTLPLPPPPSQPPPQHPQPQFREQQYYPISNLPPLLNINQYRPTFATMDPYPTPPRPVSPTFTDISEYSIVGIHSYQPLTVTNGYFAYSTPAVAYQSHPVMTYGAILPNDKLQQGMNHQQQLLNVGAYLPAPPPTNVQHKQRHIA